MKVLVCGGRDFANWKFFQLTMDHLMARHQFTEVIHGAARGADTMAGIWGRRNNLKVTEFPADWGRHGANAGPIRNAAMLQQSKPDLVVAFPGGRGTRDMVFKARAAGVKVEEVKPWA